MENLQNWLTNQTNQIQDKVNLIKHSVKNWISDNFEIDITEQVLKPKELQAIDKTWIKIMQNKVWEKAVSFKDAKYAEITKKPKKEIEDILRYIPKVSENVITWEWKIVNFYNIQNNINSEKINDNYKIAA